MSTSDNCPESVHSTGSQNRKWLAMTSSSPGGALPARHSSLKRHTQHTFARKCPLSTHTHTCREITYTDIGTPVCKEVAHINSRQQRSVQNTNREKHTHQKNHKPETTLSVHVNLTPNTFLPTLWLERGTTRICRDIQWILISGHREFQCLPERLSLLGGYPLAGLEELDGQRW